LPDDQKGIKRGTSKCPRVGLTEAGETEAMGEYDLARERERLGKGCQAGLNYM